MYSAKKPSLWKRIAGAHRSDDTTERGAVVDFFFPKLTRGFFIRLSVIIVLALAVFRFLLMPCVIDGESMTPTYSKSGFTFCKKWSYWFSPVKRSDVVVVEYTGKTYFLKRVVALAGDTVEFRHGRLLVNDQLLREPYVRYVSNWELPKRTVKPGHCYVIGDNRSQPIRQHIFGQVPLNRIVGQPLFSHQSAEQEAKPVIAPRHRRTIKKRQAYMKMRYIDLMEKVLSAYSTEHIDTYFKQVQSEGLSEHGFPRLTANIGILISHGRRTDLRERFVKMMDFCCEQIPNVSTAGNEFSIKEILWCLMLLKEKAVFPQEQLDKWINSLNILDMNKCYKRFALKPDDNVNNWALFCMVSEWLRKCNNLQTDMNFIEIQGANQTRHFDENGMFKDPGCPIVYDLVPRGLFAVLLNFGYRGKYFDHIDRNLQKSGLVSLNMQSVTGEIPYGGRSNLFLHNEAHFANVMEFEAARYAKQGNIEQARKFKNAVKLALDNLETHLQLNPIHHIKNRFPLQSRFGCESYAYFDKYMISCASFLYAAYLICDESVLPDENPVLPATAWATTDNFHWLFLRTGEYFVQIDTNANQHYDCSGIGRVHRKGAPSELCISLPCPPFPAYYLIDLPGHEALSLAPGVTANGKTVYATGEDAVYKIKSYKHTASTASAQLECNFKNGRTVLADYQLTDNGLTIKLRGKGEIAHLVPAFEFDGAEKSVIKLSGKILEVHFKNWICRYTASADITDTGKNGANRSGFYRGYETKAVNELTLRVEIVPAK